MQPKSNNANLILFLALSFLLLVGSSLVQRWLAPPPQPKAATLPVNPQLLGALILHGSNAAMLPAVSGVVAADVVAVDTAVAQDLARRQYRLPPLAEQPPKPPAEKPVQVAAQRSAKHEEIPFGGPRYKLEGLFTSRGAGVQKLILNDFNGADADGRPVDAPEELISEKANRILPSNVLYHYANPDDDAPLETLGNLDWTVKSKQVDPEADQQEVVFSTDVPGQPVRIFKTYTLRPDEYHLGVTVELQVKEGATAPIKFRYQITSGHGLPIEGEWYTRTYRDALTGWLDDSHGFRREYQDSRSIGIKLGGDAFNKVGRVQRIGYAGIAIQYFASVLSVDNNQAKQNFIEHTRPTVEGELNKDKPYLDDIVMRVTTESMELKPGVPVVHKYVFYNGPVKVRLLSDADAGRAGVPPEVVARYINDLHLNTLTDYQFPGFMGEFSSHIYWTDLIITVTNVMHSVLSFLHRIIPNYGICIIVLTVLVRGMMHPISRKQARMSIKMQALQPELKQLQEKHKNDPQEKARAQMELFRRHGVSPIGSCWVVLLQMPIFMGLYYCLMESIHFRLAPFVWIKNLAAPDMLVSWGAGIPWISRPEDMGSFFYLGPYFNLLPVLAVALMIVQQKFLMPPATDETQEMQQKMMKYMMVFMGIVFYKVAAGLCIYFIVSSAWGLAERQLLPKAKPATAGGSASGPGSRGAAVRPRPRAPKPNGTNGTLQKVQDMWAELLKQAKKK
jgi:YidC/Oxa1 family membrane protein insertase